jgi:NADPH:quinone reductase-like Zn-dependent oxidoreductase
VLAPGGTYMSPVLTARLLWDMLRTRIAGGRRARFTAVGLEKPETLRAALADVLGAIAADRFAPVMDRSYPLADLVAAQTYVAAGHKRGNVIETDMARCGHFTPAPLRSHPMPPGPPPPLGGSPGRP